MQVSVLDPRCGRMSRTSCRAVRRTPQSEIDMKQNFEKALIAGITVHSVPLLTLALVQTVVQRLEDLQLIAEVRPREEVVLQLVPDLGQHPPLGTVVGRSGVGRVGGGLLERVLILVVIAQQVVV